MALDLDKLVFQVDTAQLDTAIEKLGKVGNAVEGVNKPLKDMGTSSETAVKGTRKIVSESDKLLQSLEKVIIKQDLVNQGFSKAEAGQLANVVKVFGQSSTEFEMMKTALLNMRPAASAVKQELDKTAETVARTTRAFTSMEDRQKAITQFMTQGFSRGQASILATAKAAGAAADELGRIGAELQTQRKLQGGDPFDKSLSGLTSLKNQLVEVREATRQYNAGMQLTREQTRELARDKERIIERLKSTGGSFRDIVDAIRAHNLAYVEAANKVNALIVKEKELERQSRESANARRSIADQELKLNSVLATLTGTQNQGTNASQRAAEAIARYERSLRLAGVAGAEATKKLEDYRKKTLMVQAAEEKRKVDMLSRSLAPQISDVTVSLAGGMNPLTVLLQQGLQIRDLIGLSGVAAQDLQVAFKSAAKDMVTSIKGTASALGSLLIGSLVDAGKAVGNLGLSFLGAGDAVKNFRNQMLAANGLMNETPKLVRVLDTALKGMALAAGVGITVAIGALIALAVAIKDVIKEENELNRAVTITNSAFGVSFNSIGSYTAGLAAAGYATKDLNQVMVEMAKAGNLNVRSFDLVAKAAIDLRDKAGIPIEDTVKKFSELAKKPSETLGEFAQQSGRVNQSILSTVYELERQGKTFDAAKLAIQEYSAASVQAANEVVQNYGVLTKLGIELKELWNSAWDSIMGIGRRTVGVDRIAELRKQLEDVSSVTGNSTFANFRKKQIEDEIAGLQRSLLLETERNIQRQQNAATAKLEGVAAKARENALSKELKYGQEILRINKNIADARLAGRDDLVKVFEDERERVKKEFTDKNKDKKGPKSQTEKDNDQYLRWLERIADLTDDARKKQEDYTRAQKLALDLFNEPAFARLPENLRKEIAAKLELAHVEELRGAAAEKARKQEEARANLLSEVEKATRNVGGASEFYGSWLEKINEASLELNLSLEDQIDLFNKLARAKFNAEDKKLADKNKEYRQTTQDAIDRTIFENSIPAGTRDSTRERMLKEYEIELDLRRKIKEIDDSQASPDQKNARIAEAIGIANQNKELARYNETVAESKRLSDGFADALTTAFSDLVVGGKSFEDVLTSLEQAIINLITQILVLEPLQASLRDMFKNTGGSGGGGFNFSGMIDSFAGWVTGLFGFADGGRPPMNQVSIVGEEGPELFVPDVQGRIIPNHKAKGFMDSQSGGSSGQSITIQQTFVVQGAPSRETQNQLASSALSGAQIALRRNS